MYQWFYCYLKYYGTALILFNATVGKQVGTRILLDPDLDDDLSDTLYRYIATLGADGWELIGIAMPDGINQDWIFKKLFEVEG